MKIPVVKPPLGHVDSILGEALKGELVVLTNSLLHEPLTQMKTACYIEHADDKAGSFFVGTSLIQHDTPYTHTFTQELDSRLREIHEDTGMPLHTSFPDVGNIKLGIRISLSPRGLFSTVRLACLAEGWDVLTQLGFKGVPVSSRVEDALTQHYDIVNLLSRTLIEHTVDIPQGRRLAQEVAHYNVESGLVTPPEAITAVVDIPELRESKRNFFQEFAGIDYIIEELLDMVTVGSPGILDGHESSLRIPALLLYGESGVGKTQLAKTIACALDADFAVFGVEDFQSPYIGGWSKKITDMFDEAFNSTTRTVIVLDEFDSMVRTGHDDMNSNIIGVLKSKLEDLQDYPHVFVVMTSNSLDGIDPAVIADKRVPLKLHIPLPNEEERRLIFAKALGIDPDMDASRLGSMDALDAEDFVDVLEYAHFDLSELARNAPDFSPGDIHKIIDAAVRRLKVRSGKGREDLTHDDLMRALDFARKNRPQSL